MNLVLALGVAAVSVVVGLVVLVRAGQRRVGWLLVAHGVCFGALVGDPGTSTSKGGMVLDQLAAGAWVFIFLWLVLVAYLVPDGHAVSPGWRRWMLTGLTGVAAFLVGSAGDADAFREAHRGADPPLALVPAPLFSGLGVAGLLLTALFFFGAMFAVRTRLRSASGNVRLQLLWLVWGATSLPLALVLAWVGHFALDGNALVIATALALAGIGLPVTIGIAVLRHRLFDIELVLSRTLTYGVLVAAVASLYAAFLYGAEQLLGSSTAGGVLAVALIAAAGQPAYSILHRRVERWVYGYRADPAVALRRLGASLESTDPLRVVDTITTSVADALKVERVWVSAPGEVESPPDPRVVRVPLLHRDDHLGDLAVEVPAGRRLSPADTALLHDLVRHASVTIRAAQLAGELQASRSRIVTAREEERKRLRRELHDGVGPSLAAILLMLDVARSRDDVTERNALLAEIRDETKAAITEVRRAVDELRPPAIDEVGLPGALRQRAASLSTDRLVFQVDSPLTLPPIPAAVEVAVFRIASEAMTNVVKHSHASRCSVDLACGQTLDQTLDLTVSDNGRGSASGGASGRGASGRGASGVGWHSMTERAAELGGSCTISNRAEGGLVVRAVLPLREVVALEVIA